MPTPGRRLNEYALTKVWLGGISPDVRRSEPQLGPLEGAMGGAIPSAPGALAHWQRGALVRWCVDEPGETAAGGGPCRSLIVSLTETRAL